MRVCVAGENQGAAITVSIMSGLHVQHDDDLNEVLSLCLAFVKDVTTLLRISLASKHHRDVCKGHLQHGHMLPMLLCDAVVLGAEKGGCDWQYNEYRSVAVDWLCKAAGQAAVSAPAVAEALMLKSDNIAPDIAEQLIQVGVRLTTKHIAAAAKRRVQGLHVWLRASCASLLPMVGPGIHIPANLNQLVEQTHLPAHVLAALFARTVRAQQEERMCEAFIACTHMSPSSGHHTATDYGGYTVWIHRLGTQTLRSTASSRQSVLQA